MTDQDDKRLGQHTPGPWILCGGDTDTRFVAAEEPLRFLAEMVPDDENPVTPEEQEANARLIAAAPDLLAAATQVNEWWDLIRQNYPEMLPHGFNSLRAAIAKATGND